MKKRLLLSGMVWCLTSVPSTACYLINTAGLGEFKTSGYWREGAEIRFFMPNGVMGITESEIQKITRLQEAQRAGDCSWAAESREDFNESQEPEESAEDTDSSVAPLSGPKAVITATSAVPASKSEVYQQFEERVAAFETQMGRLGTMSRDELYDLAKIAEYLKKDMIDAHEGEALNPLLVKVFAGLEQIESMMAP